MVLRRGSQDNLGYDHHFVRHRVVCICHRIKSRVQGHRHGYCKWIGHFCFHQLEFVGLLCAESELCWSQGSRFNRIRGEGQWNCWCNISCSEFEPGGRGLIATSQRALYFLRRVGSDSGSSHIWTSLPSGRLRTSGPCESFHQSLYTSCLDQRVACWSWWKSWCMNTCDWLVGFHLFAMCVSRHARVFSQDALVSCVC